MPAVPAVAEAAEPLEDLDEPPEPRVRGGSGRAGLMKPLVVLALPGMYLFYKYSQYRREQRELSRRRVTERELQHLHHKIDKLLTKLEENEPELASSQEDEVTASSLAFDDNKKEAPDQLRERRSPQGGPPNCPPPPQGQHPNGPPPSGAPPCGPPPSELSTTTSGSMASTENSRMRRALMQQLSGQGGQGGMGIPMPGGGGMGIPMPGGGGMDMGSMGNMGGMGKYLENMPNPMACVICVNARATMQTAPCGHRVVCRRCFVKTIQMAVSQRLLPLRCVICRAKILRLKQTLIPRDYSMSGKSWVLPQSASEYNMGTGVSVGVTGPGGRWLPGNVPASASLYSMASGSSSISGVSSVSSSSSSSASSTGSSSLGKPTRVRQPSGATLRRSQTQSMKLRIQEYQDPVQQVTEEEEVMRENRERRLPPIKEFQRDYRAGKASTRIRCAQKIVTQLETSPSPRGSTSGATSTSGSLARTSTKRPQSSPKLSVVQEVQKSKKEKEREKEREKAEKARQKEEEKAEKTRQKEAKKLAKEEKKRAKKEAKARRKEAEEALLREEK